ncbi:phytoene desaturase family protein [Melioribacter sp. OK-6-Me]|uniref:phytoene desaturase family protein n=1 Tax=unclassified Melioribacter TaxID=2627329 RepID=UPI003EDAF6D4
MNKKVLIVGTGIGGLATGLRLASRGYKVIFVEKNHQPGGRLNRIKEAGFTFDTGPSFFSMPYEFEELMNDCGISMPFEFIELNPLYTVHFKNGEKPFYIYKDIEKLNEQLEKLEPQFERKFRAYLKKCEQIYKDTVDIVIKQNFDTIFEFILALMKVNPAHLPVLIKSFWEQTSSFFESKELRQIISLIAFFLGRTPFDTNAVYTLLSYIEFKYTGYYNVKGGMYTIVTSLVNRLRELEAEFYYDTEIVDFRGNKDKLISLIDQNGKEWKADLFVINSDAAWFRGKVFKRTKFSDQKLNKMNWTMGYLTAYIGVNRKLQQVEHHNYFLGDNFEEYSRDVMRDPGILEKPYYYVNVISKYNNECAPEGCEALFFVCPVPNLIYKKDWSDRDSIVNSIINDFSERIGEDISKDIIYKKAFTPLEWQDQFNLYKGSGLGLAHDIKQVGAFRPKNFDEQFKNTFYVGASTVPGAGLPMAVISSRLVAERIYDSKI